MKLTIDIDWLSKTQSYAFRNGVVGGDFHRVVGEAVASAMAKLRTFSEDNDSVAIDSHIAGYVEGEVGDLDGAKGE